jgi:hypothetical protein
MPKRKQIIALLLMAVLLLFAAACGTEPSAETAAPTGTVASSQNTTTTEDSWTDYNSIEEACDAVGFDFTYPEPADATESSFRTTNGIVEATYTASSGDTLMFRKGDLSVIGKDKLDISGVTDSFDNVQSQDIDGRVVQFKGNGDEVHVMVWQSNGFAYAIYSTAAYTLQQAQYLVVMVE